MDGWMDEPKNNHMGGAWVASGCTCQTRYLLAFCTTPRANSTFNASYTRRLMTHRHTAKCQADNAGVYVQWQLPTADRMFFSSKGRSLELCEPCARHTTQPNTSMSVTQ